MNPRRRPFAILLQLAFVATLLMALAPLVSRWQQAHADTPLQLMPMTTGGGFHLMPATPAASPAHAGPAGHHGDHHAMAGHAQHPAAGVIPSANDAPVPMPVDAHAGHGEACEYCMMASRLLPWLAVALLLLPLLPVIGPRVVRATATPRTLRWPAHGARGPPLYS
ncbi:MAG: hypothetical protein ACOH1V_11525 [Stenotrophomonas sp.]